MTQMIADSKMTRSWAVSTHRRHLRDLRFLLVIALALTASCSQAEPPMQLPEPSPEVIQPDADHPMFWRFQGKPAVLIGGSVEDNLFQIQGLDEHLDALVAAGGNYVRCTMSSRDEGDVWPFFLDTSTGKYDLTRDGDEYWRRFDHFLEATAARGIVVQIELWDRFDLAREPWLKNPFNPANNTNYTVEQSGLQTTYDQHPGKIDHPFFRAVPTMDDNAAVFPFQKRFIDRLLQSTLRHGHVLYCMDNETHVGQAWGAYWSRYLQETAAAQGRRVYTTQMWDPWDLGHAMHRRTFDHPELYGFLEVSQNNHKTGQEHYDNLLAFRQRVLESGKPRPMNMVKIYGADTGRFGNDRDAIERFWRALFGGVATARFHRPPAGIGLGDTAQRHLRAARLLLDAAGERWFTLSPRNDLLSGREPNEAFCLAGDSGPWVVWFADGGAVRLAADAKSVRWLDVQAGRWQEPAAVTEGELRTPGAGYWVALVE